jgi:hypothetical protein
MGEQHHRQRRDRSQDEGRSTKPSVKRDFFEAERKCVPGDVLRDLVEESPFAARSWTVWPSSDKNSDFDCERYRLTAAVTLNPHRHPHEGL